jgi:hypothetical protein
LEKILGKIYKLVPIIYEGEFIIYYGSTVEKFLSTRLAKHKAQYKLQIDGKINNYYTSFKLFDDYGIEKYPDIPMYTYIFALDTVPEFKTIVWKEIVKSNADIPNYLKLWNLKRHKLPKTSSISADQDLEHTYDENAQAYLCDYLNLDGIFEYQAGSGVLFNGRQLHCTSNWLKYKKFKSRELLQIHVVSHDLKTSLT